MRRIAFLATCLLPLTCASGRAAPATPATAPQATVTVYRCTDAAGNQTLRDTPCPKGQKQQAREMLRPVDAPARATPVARPAPAAPPPPPTTVYLVPPRPMYECTTDDGDRYTSESGDGNPRWVPLWTLGYRYDIGHGAGTGSTGNFRPAGPLAAGISTATPPAPPPLAPSRRPHRGWPGTAGGGTWIRDSCALLPPREVCDRLRDRRGQIRARFFNAQEKERDALRLEERGINARLDNDCGGR